MKKTWLLLSTLFISQVVYGESIHILSMQSNDTPKKALEKLGEEFKKKTNIDVKITTLEHEALKASIKKHLKSAKYDIVTWHAGNRARELAKRGLISPIDSYIKNIDEFGEGIRVAVSFARSKKAKNKQFFCVPHAYYHWSLYYNQKVLKKHKVDPNIKTWSDFKQAVKVLNKSGVTPIALGGKDTWTAGGWFDFIGMHSYGFSYHRELLAGEHKYTSPEVKKAMGYWVDLAKMGAFEKKVDTRTWTEAAQMLVDGKAGFMLQGNFWIGEMKVPIKGSDIKALRFPLLDGAKDSYGVAPTDVLCMAAGSKRKDSAGKFLNFVAQAETQENNAKRLALLPPNKKAKVNPDDEFSIFGKAYLNDTKGITQFYDRDADPNVARRGMDMMVNLISAPEKLEEELNKVESVRKRKHGKIK